MTVENTNSKSGPYDLDGSTLRFPRDFFLERPEHLQVFQVIDGVATLLTTGFTVTGIGSDEGEVIFSAEGYPVGGGVLMLKRNVPNTQETDYSNQARVKPEQVEIDLDKIVRQIQDLREVVNRSLHISIDQDLSDADLDRMSRAVIALGEIRDELEALYGKIPELQAVYDDLDEVTLAGRNIEAIKAFSGSVLSLVDKSFVATGGQTAFQLDVMAFAPENVIVWLNKIRLVPDLDYTTDGSTLILSAGASAGDVVDTLTISAVSMEDVKRIRDEALDAANKIKEAAVMQQTTFLIEEGKRIYQLYKDGRPVSVWEYGVRLFIAPYGPLVERQDYHILPDGRIELHHDFDPGSLGIADFMVRYTDSEIQQIILGTKENADRAEAAADRAAIYGPRTVKDAASFHALTALDVGRYSSQDGFAWDVSDTGPGDFTQAGKYVTYVRTGGMWMKYANIINPSGGSQNLLFQGVYDAIRVHFEPRTNIWEGVAYKGDFMFDPYNLNPVDYRLFNFIGYKGDPNGTGESTIALIGSKGVGYHWGPASPSIHIGFMDDGINGVPMKWMYFDHSMPQHYTPNKGGWLPGMPVAVGDHVSCLVAGICRFYVAASAGTTGVAPPAHTSGTVSDGAVNWTFLHTVNTATLRPVTVVGNRDDMPVLGHQGVRMQFLREYLTDYFVKQLFLRSNKQVGASWYTTNTGGGAEEWLQLELAGGGRQRFNMMGNYVQNVGVAVSASVVNAVAGDTTPDVSGVETLNFNNTSATTITAFDSGVPGQRIRLTSTNDNTTIQVSPAATTGGVIRSATGANIRLNVGSAVDLERHASANFWRVVEPPVEVNSAAATDFAGAANAINTQNKYTGKQVWDTTNNRMMRARGPAASDPWDVIDGSASVTPV